jgi:type IV pilus assembly protein PilW
VLVGYVATSTSAISTLAESKLNHELASLMSLMINDIRRAGYWGTLAALDDPTVNPFNIVNQSTLSVFDSSETDNMAGTTGNGTCLTYTYDMNRNGTLEAEELTGFRLRGGVVQMRTSGISGPASCAGPNDVWENLTDGAQINVTTLNFDLAESVCLNTREPDDLDNDGNSACSCQWRCDRRDPGSKNYSRRNVSRRCIRTSDAISNCQGAQ